MTRQEGTHDETLFIHYTLFLLLILPLAACGGNGDNTTNDIPQDQNQGDVTFLGKTKLLNQGLELYNVTIHAQLGSPVAEWAISAANRGITFVPIEN